MSVIGIDVVAILI